MLKLVPVFIKYLVDYIQSSLNLLAHNMQRAFRHVESTVLLWKGRGNNRHNVQSVLWIVPRIPNVMPPIVQSLAVILFRKR